MYFQHHTYHQCTDLPPSRTLVLSHTPSNRVFCQFPHFVVFGSLLLPHFVSVSAIYERDYSILIPFILTLHSMISSSFIYVTANSMILYNIEIYIILPKRGTFNSLPRWWQGILTIVAWIISLISEFIHFIYYYFIIIINILFIHSTFIAFLETIIELKFVGELYFGGRYILLLAAM